MRYTKLSLNAFHETTPLNHWTGKIMQFTKFKFKGISCNYPFDNSPKDVKPIIKKTFFMTLWTSLKTA